MADENQQQTQYAAYRRPGWAPPSWVFGPVWTVLYVIIAVSFGRVAFLYATGGVPLAVAWPFLANLIFNVAYTPLQFRFRNYFFASVDVLLVFATLFYAMYSIYSFEPWIAYANIPYLLWTAFATVLQLTVTYMNRRRA